MELYHRESGEGQPIIIMHGLMGSSDNWLTVTKPIAEKHKVYLTDQRNHGRSPRSDIFTYQAMADDLYEFIEKNNINNPIIVGHSMGGKIAMKFASQHQDLISKLVIVDIAPRYYPPHHQHILAGLHNVDLASLQTRNQADELLSIHITEPDVRMFLLKNLYRDENGNFAWRVNLKVITAEIENIGESLPENTSISVPTLFIHGEYSDYILPSDIQHIRQIFSDVELISIPRCGHWVQAEKPQEFLEALFGFID